MRTTYSQNFEDIILFRALRFLDRGFYVDVGANHPDRDSVTKLFYDMGWSGINVEPSKEFYNKLEKKRPNDININAAVSSECGELDFHDIAHSGLSSLDNITVHRASRLSLAHRSYSIPVITLNYLFEQHCFGKVIAFLKIDVEGWERQVIEGLDLKKWRPIIILVEAIHPDTQEPTWCEWESMILESGYSSVWFDGINKFYLRNEDIHLQMYFNCPPNLLDDFCVSPHHFLARNARLLRIKIALKRFLPKVVYDVLRRMRAAFRG